LTSLNSKIFYHLRDLKRSTSIGFFLARLLAAILWVPVPRRGALEATRRCLLTESKQRSQQAPPIDLDPRAFKRGDAATTIVSHIGATIWRCDDDADGNACFEIALFRSLCQSFWD